MGGECLKHSPTSFEEKSMSNKQFIDYTGCQFGKLRVIKRIGSKRYFPKKKENVVEFLLLLFGCANVIVVVKLKSLVTDYEQERKVVVVCGRTEKGVFVKDMKTVLRL